jgi:hypothetical protein
MMMKTRALILGITLLGMHVSAVEPKPDVAPDMAAFKAKLQATVTKHLDLLLKKDGTVATLKGKGANGEEALAFYRLYELTGENKYQAAALQLVDRVLKDMRATKFGVLPIKEKEKAGGEKFIGGGPPAFGFYTANLAYILHREGGRTNDLVYLGKVVDAYAWSESGWWAQDIDVETGEPKVPLSKPSIINKSAAMAMSAGMLSEALREIAPELSKKLKAKTDKFIYSQLIPAQTKDGFWHYNLNGNNPKDKDILGYFMLTVQELMELQHFNPAYREPKLDAVVRKAQEFAAKHIAPMTEPNTGQASSPYMTSSTPKHYDLSEEPKRGFQLANALFGGGFQADGIKITEAALKHFPVGDGGMDGAHAASPSAAILVRLTAKVKTK